MHTSPAPVGRCHRCPLSLPDGILDDSNSSPHDPLRENTAPVINWKAHGSSWRGRHHLSKVTSSITAVNEARAEVALTVLTSLHTALSTTTHQEVKSTESRLAQCSKSAQLQLGTKHYTLSFLIQESTATQSPPPREAAQLTFPAATPCKGCGLSTTLSMQEKLCCLGKMWMFPSWDIYLLAHP